jgi:integrase
MGGSLKRQGAAMPRSARELKPLDIQRLVSPGRHHVGVVPGLCLQVRSPTSTSQRRCRTWVLRIVVAGKRRDIGLGGYPEVGLAQARQRARDVRDTVARGLDPLVQKREAQAKMHTERLMATTFERAAHEYLDAHSASWRNAKHAAQWRSTLATYTFPVLGQQLVRDVDRAQVLAVLQPIWQTKTETASRVRGRIEQVISFAVQAGYREDGLNPARWRGNLDKVLGDPQRITKTQHHRAISVAQAPAFMARLASVPGHGARALEFAVLTAARSGEVRGATWAEIDLDAAVWTIPAARMKAQREHRVPLSSAALSILRNLPRVVKGQGADIVFCNTKQGPLSDMTLTAVMRRLGEEAVPHGFRSTFRDWAAEKTNYPNEVCEAALAHTVGDKVEAAYRRGDLFDKRRRLMTDWASYLFPSSS